VLFLVVVSVGRVRTFRKVIWSFEVRENWDGLAWGKGRAGGNVAQREKGGVGREKRTPGRFRVKTKELAQMVVWAARGMMPEGLVDTDPSQEMLEIE
jgi:hypothetical protein